MKGIDSMYYFYLKSKGELDLEELKKALKGFFLTSLIVPSIKAIALFIEMIKEFTETLVANYDILSLLKVGFNWFIIAIIIDIIKIYRHNKNN